MADCANCARHLRARDAARSQLEALWAETERLASDLARALAAAPLAAAAGDGDDAVDAGEAPCAAPARRPPPTAGAAPDVLCGGDGRLPRAVIARLALAAAGGGGSAAPPSKTLAATLFCLRAPQRALVISASADKRVALWEAVRPHAPDGAPRALATATAPSPVLCFSGAIALGGDGGGAAAADVEVCDCDADVECSSWPAVPCAAVVAGHVDGSVSLWAVLRATAPPGAAPPRQQLRLECVTVHAGAHSKFVTRALETGVSSLAGGGALVLTTSTDGTAAVWAVEVGGAASALPRLRQMQLLAFPSAPTSAAWRPPRDTASGGGDGGGASAPACAPLASFVIAVESASYLYYFDVVGEGGSPCSLLLRRVPLSEDGLEIRLTDDASASTGVATASRLPLQLAAGGGGGPGGARLPGPEHHPDASAIHLPVSGALDVVPVGFSVVDMAATEQGGGGGGGGGGDGGGLHVPRASLLASATTNGLILLSAWGSNRVLRRFAGHLTSITPTFTAASASLAAAALRVLWLPRLRAASGGDAAAAPALYLLATTDAGSSVAVFSLASGRVVDTLGDDGGGGGVPAPRSSPRTCLRSLCVAAFSPAPSQGPLLLTLDNSSNVVLRALSEC